MWARLPGPTDFLDTILEDMVDHVTVFAGLPDEIPSGDLAVEIADLVKHRRLGQWYTVRSAESQDTKPSRSVSQRFGGSGASDSVLWVDATGGDAAATAWADYACGLADYSDSPRLCVAMNAAYAEARNEDKRLRRRLWRDFVTPLDSRALAERVGRRAGYRPSHIALRSALIAEIADADLAFAERLSRDPLGRILQAGHHAREKIWAAQVSILLPIIERERRRLLAAHQPFWKLPHIRKDGTEINELNDLEIGDMAAQARPRGPLDGVRKRLDWLRRVRNALAHNEVVPWATLTSPIAIRVMDFR